MPEKWLQVKGDPSIRQFLFEQSRQVSLFDEHIDEVHEITKALAARKGVFHVKIHYSSSQLTCWFVDDPLNYKVYVKDEVLAPGFIDLFPDISYEGRRPRVLVGQVDEILNEFKRLRTGDDQIYLRSGSFNRMNAMIGMNFSCDGSHYIEFDYFFDHLKEFGKGNV